MPTHEHLFHPGHARTARHIVARGWPSGYLAVCVLCGVPVDLVAALLEEPGTLAEPEARDGEGGGDPSGSPPPSP